MRKCAQGSQMSLEGNPKWKPEKLPVRFSLWKRFSNGQSLDNKNSRAPTRRSGGSLIEISHE